MVELAILNSRMKDYHDIHYLLSRFTFNGDDLQLALQATFKRRQTPLPLETPTGLDKQFRDDPSKVRQWDSFIGKNRLSTRIPLERVCEDIVRFVMPASRAEASSMTWSPGKGWNL